MKPYLIALWRALRAWTGTAVGRDTESVDWFLAGHSIPKISALMLPGIGGPILTQQQRTIEADIRSYMAGLEQENAQLRDRVADLLDEKRAAAAQQAQPSQPDPDPAGAALLGELLASV